MQKTGRNDPCPCGSGKKYKKCCLNKEQENKSIDVPMKEPEYIDVTEKYITKSDYINNFENSIKNIDFFFIEIANIEGNILHKFNKFDNNTIKMILLKSIEESIFFYKNCKSCEYGCLNHPYKIVDFKSLFEKGLKLNEFPKVLRKKNSLNFFYYEFINNFVVKLEDELLKMNLEKNDISALCSCVYYSLIDYIADCCWESCGNLCIIEHDKLHVSS